MNREGASKSFEVGKTPAEIPIFEYFPELKKNIGWLKLTQLPTPLEYLSSISKKFGAEIYVKRDDLSSPIYGGNKPRKLEFILGLAQKRGCKNLISFGVKGSNHILALSMFCKKLNFNFTPILVPDPFKDPVHLQTYRLIEKLCPSRREVTGDLKAALSAGLLFCKNLLTGNRCHMIYPGGSTPVGTLGYVNAAFELHRQFIDHRESFEGSELFVAVGSNGTAAGLLAGFSILRFPIKIVGVRVSDWPVVTERNVIKLAEKTLRILRENGGKSPLSLDFGIDLQTVQFEFLEDYLGEGYARPTEKGRRAVALLEELENIAIENTYTGKAFAALLDRCSSNPGIKKIFINTFNSRRVDPSL